MHILNLVLLTVELLCLTPLSGNSIFHSLSKVRALRALLLIQLVYQKSREMKLIFEAFVKCLPFIFQLATVIVFLFTWSTIIGVKVYKEDGYYCHNAFKKVETK